MPHHCLPAGTDVAEMALFDIDAMPQARPPDAKAVDQLAAQERLIRLPTGSDGAYLLHLFVDEAIPDRVLQFCIADDKLIGRFNSTGGRIAFGGVESAFQDFKPNQFIRSDVLVPPGRYAYTAYRTDIPDEIVDQATRVESTPAERWLSRAPLLITLTTLALAFTLAAVSGRSLVVLPVLMAAYFALKIVKRTPSYKALLARRREAQLAFPSIVIEMWSNPSIERTPAGQPAGASHVKP
jgi:hypothetical protein